MATVIFWLVAAIFWVLQGFEVAVLIVVPIVGLVALGLALYHHPKELLSTIRRVIKLEGDDGQANNLDEDPLVA